MTRAPTSPHSSAGDANPPLRQPRASRHSTAPTSRRTRSDQSIEAGAAMLPLPNGRGHRRSLNAGKPMCRAASTSHIADACSRGSLLCCVDWRTYTMAATQQSRRQHSALNVALLLAIPAASTVLRQQLDHFHALGPVRPRVVLTRTRWFLRASGRRRLLRTCRSDICVWRWSPALELLESAHWSQADAVMVIPVDPASNKMSEPTSFARDAPSALMRGKTIGSSQD